MAEFTLTKEIIEKANTYLPLAQKIALAQKVAEACIDKVEITVNGDKSDTIAPLPPRYTENAMRKAQYLMEILTTIYLKQPIDDNEPMCMPLDLYDKYGGSHIFNQLERAKRIAGVSDRVYDLIADYRIVEKMINSEIYALLQTQNDPCIRIFSMFEMQSSPDALKNAMAQAAELKSQLTEYENGAKQPQEE